MEEHRRFTRTSVHMEELRSRQEQKHRRRRVFYVLLFAGVSIAFLAICFFLFFRVSEIRIVGNEIYTEEQILEKLPFAEGDNVFSFRTSRAESDLRKELTYIGQVTIRRELPSVIVVEVSERKMELSLTVGEEAYLLSGDLQVLDRIGASAATDHVTQLQAGAIERCIVGESVSFKDERTADALKELYRYLSANGMMEKVDLIDMTSRFDISLRYEGRFTVYLGDMANMDIKVRFLEGIVEKLDDGARGYIYLSDHREASVRLEQPSKPETEPDTSDAA